VADWMSSRPQQAEQALAEVVAARRAAGEGYLAMRVAYDLGQVQRGRGRLVRRWPPIGKGWRPAAGPALSCRMLAWPT
jgi:hypothetical protein